MQRTEEEHEESPCAKEKCCAFRFRTGGREDVGSRSKQLPNGP